MAVILTVAVIFYGSSFSVSYAWGWENLIPPGSEVFDLKRFTDSVKETAQAVLVVQNSLKNLQNRILFNTAIGSDFNSVLQALKNFGDMPKGDSLVNPKNDYKNTPFGKDWDDVRQAIGDSTYEQKINEELTYSNTELVTVMQQVIGHETSREEALENLQQLETDGVLGEKQQINAVAILNALTIGDQARLTGGQLMNDISQQEASYAIRRLDQEKIKAGTAYGYDPYHPSDFDNNHKPENTSSFGFLKFGE